MPVPAASAQALLQSITMNLVVVAAHGLNCHWVGPYGNEWVSTPAFDALAGEAVVFDQHYADDPSPTGFGTISPPALMPSLRQHRVVTLLVDDRKLRTADERPWDHVIRTDLASHSTPGDAFITAVESALDHLATNSPWLLWIETDRLLPPWDFDAETYQHYASASERFAGDNGAEPDGDSGPIDNPVPGRLAPEDDSLWHRLHNSFASAVTSFDAEVEVLIEVLRERGLDQTAAWIFTSGYGWPLGEHGVIGPDASRLHTELVHLPLLIRLPGNAQAMRRVPTFTQSSDLMPTLLEQFKVSEYVPHSLLPLTAGTPTSVREAARCRMVRPTYVERALRTPEWTFLPAVPQAGEPPRLYRRPDDVWEVNDVAPRHPDECDRLAALLDQIESLKGVIP
jgi:arylsulfatase A-like enzyme